MWQGHFADLFTSHRVYANQKLASAYGIPGVLAADLAGGPRRRRARSWHPHATCLLGGDEPAFGAPTMLSTGGCSSTIPSLAVYPLEPPPPNEDVVFKTLMGTDDKKAHSAMPCPPAALATMRSIRLGSWATTTIPSVVIVTTDPDQPGTPIDVSAVIRDFGPDLDGPVNGINDLAQRLAKGQRAPDCAARHLLKMTLNHDPAQQDSCQLDRIKSDFVRSGSFAELFKAIVTSPAFLTRDWDK